MALNIGDLVRVKSLDWYKSNLNNFGDIVFPTTTVIFCRDMQDYCGQEARVIGYVQVSDTSSIGYRLSIDATHNHQYTWTIEMLDSVKIMRHKKLEKIKSVYKV